MLITNGAYIKVSLQKGHFLPSRAPQASPYTTISTTDLQRAEGK